MKKLALWSLTLLIAAAASAQEKPKPEETEVWEPEPKVVTAPGMGKAPSDAIILFDGTNLNEWVSAKDGAAPKWEVKDGVMTIVPSTGDLLTKRTFGDFQLHLEWRSPDEPNRKGQDKGNSGVFMQDRYEVQILNSYENRTYSNGQAASIYKQSIPLVNATSKPGDWNTYDIIYTAPRFRQNGSLERPAYITVIHNGVVVQNHVEIHGTTEYIGAPKYIAHGKGPIRLQDHSNPVSFRNIWIREM
ncbi:3-keto-disaccharide hydrolase [Rhodoflexus sp.]